MFYVAGRSHNVMTHLFYSFVHQKRERISSKRKNVKTFASFFCLSLFVCERAVFECSNRNDKILGVFIIFHDEILDFKILGK